MSTRSTTASPAGPADGGAALRGRAAFVARHVPSLHPLRTNKEIRAPSWTEPGKTYLMHDCVSGRTRMVLCSCPGFLHRGECKHMWLQIELHPMEGVEIGVDKPMRRALLALDRETAKRREEVA